MLGQAKKLITRIGQVWSLFGAGIGLRYTAVALTKLPAILKTRNLMPVDG